MRYYLAVFGALLLGSCSLARPVIQTKIVGDDVVFEAFRTDGAWFFPKDQPYPLTVDRFVVYGRAGATWVIERRNEPKCRGDLSSNFPLIYGRLPKCFVERLGAKPLRSGMLYRVTADGYPSAEGFFRITRTIDAPHWQADYEEAETWPAETNPNTTYPKADWIDQPINSEDAANMISNAEADVIEVK